MAARRNQDNSARMIAAARIALRSGVQAGALLIENEAKILTPVLTGTLRRSINTEVQQVSADRVVARIGPNTEYASFVEFGTSRMSAQPYMRPALDTRREAARRVIMTMVRDAIGAK